MSGKIYPIRYLVEPWNKPRGTTTKTSVPGVRISTDNYGYADELFVASIIKGGEDGDNDSVLLLSTEGTMKPSRRILELVRDQIIHQLEHHTEN